MIESDKNGQPCSSTDFSNKNSNNDIIILIVVEIIGQFKLLLIVRFDILL